MIHNSKQLLPQSLCDHRFHVSCTSLPITQAASFYQKYF